MTAPSAARRRRRGLRTVGLLLLLLLLALAWAGWQALRGARALQDAAAGVQAAQADLGGPAGGAAQLRSVAAQTERARGHFEDPLVRVVAAVPVLGEPLASAVAVSRAADLTVRQALLPLVTAAGDDPGARLTRGPGSVDVDYLASLAAPSATAARAVRAAATTLERASADTGVGRVDDAVRDLRTELGQVREVVEQAEAALAVAPDLLAKDGSRRYLVVSQSPAEARGTGGIVGGYTLVEVRDGALTILRSGPRSELRSYPEPVVDLGPQFREHYGDDGAGRGWINSNLSPHYPYAAQIWTALWQRQYGERLDGAVVLDPLALSYLLEATGPVATADGTQVSAGNVVDLTLRDVYARFPGFGDDPRRDAVLQQVSTGVAQALTERELPGRTLVRAMSRAVQERRLLLWSADAEVQSRLEEQAVGGALPQGRTVGDVIVNSAGSKLDYYLDRELVLTEGCGGASTLTLALVNGAPATGLPEYVTPERTRDDGPPGTNVVVAALYLPQGSLLSGLSIDGQPVVFRQGTERGLVWVEARLALRPGARRTMTATFTETRPDAGPLQRLVQPLVREETFTRTGC